MKTPRKGTVLLLELTKKLSELERKELLTYIGQLEQSEDRAYQAVKDVARSLGLLNS